MVIHYAITGSNQDTQDLSAWVAAQYPHLMASGIFQVGTGQAVKFSNGDDLDAGEVIEQSLVELAAETLTEMESIIRAIRTFDFEVTGSLSKYNATKKVFIVDLTHRVGDAYEMGETIEALSTFSCTLDDELNFAIRPDTLSSTHASCYGGEDDWGKDVWNNVATQNAFAEFSEQITSKREHRAIDADQFIVELIDKLYIESIKTNLEAVTAQAKSAAIVI